MTDTTRQEEKSHFSAKMISKSAKMISKVELLATKIASFGDSPPSLPDALFPVFDPISWPQVRAEIARSGRVVLQLQQEKQHSKLQTETASRVEVDQAESKQLEREPDDKLWLENQLLQSRVSEERRNAGRATRQYDQLLSEFHRVQAQNDKLLECLNGRIEALDTTTKLLLQRSNGRLRMIESYEGVVEHVQGDSATVVFEIDDDIVEHTYKRSQFIDGQLPEEGDRLAVYVHVVHGEVENSDDASAVVDELDDGQEYERKKITGPVEF